MHLLRKLVLAFAIGFCFSPVTGRDHGVADMRRQFHTAAAERGEESSELMRSRLSKVLEPQPLALRP